MHIIILLVLVIVIGVYLYMKSQNKFTRGGDINKQGDEMDKDSNTDKSSDDTSGEE